MGCCCSTEQESLSQDGEVNERTHLLNDPVSSNYQVTSSSSDYGNHYSTSATKKSDDQSFLNQILQNTASSIIDVGAQECHPLERHEYIERVRTYNQRIGALPPVKPLSKRHHEVQLLHETTDPERIMASQPISLADYNMMVNASERVLAAIAQIKVEHKEDLVVPFRIP